MYCGWGLEDGDMTSISKTMFFSYYCDNEKASSIAIKNTIIIARHFKVSKGLR